MSNTTYDRLKWIDTVFLPAGITLYVALAQIWGLPYSAEVAGTGTAIITFIGALLGISSVKYGLTAGSEESDHE